MDDRLSPQYADFSKDAKVEDMRSMVVALDKFEPIHKDIAHIYESLIKIVDRLGVDIPANSVPSQSDVAKSKMNGHMGALDSHADRFAEEVFNLSDLVHTIGRCI